MVWMICSGIFGAVAAGCWLTAAISWGLSLRHLVEGESAWSHVFNGMRSFNPEHFEPEGQRHQRRMLVGMAGFALGGVMAALCALLGSAIGGTP